MATYGDMKDRVKYKCGNKTGIDDIVGNNINEAQRQLVYEVRPEEMRTTATFSTSDATPNYTFSGMSVTDLYAIEMVRNTTDQRLIKAGSLSEYESLTQTGDNATGEPTRWFRLGSSIYLYSQVPDDTARTIRLTYLKHPTALSADADEFSLNDEWVKPVEELAAAMTFNDLNQFDKAQAKLAGYRELLGFRETPRMVEDESPEGQFVFVSNPMDNS